MSDTDFWITPAGLEQQAKAFDQCAELLFDAKSWVDGHPVGDAAAYPLYSGAAERAATINSGLSTFFGHVREALIASRTELLSVAQEARGMDMQTAAELDVLDPTEYNDYDPGAPGTGASVKIAPKSDRTDDLIFQVYSLNGGGIGFYLAADGMFDYVNERETRLMPGDLLSPSEWIWTVAGWIGAQSIKDDLLKVFGGKWVELYEFRYMLSGVEKMLNDIADNLQSAADALAVYWQGYSANSAQSYFTLLIAKIRDSGRQIGDAGDEFDSFLDGVDKEFDVLSGAAHGFIDALIIAAFAAAAGTVTAETGVGAVAGWGVAGVSLLYAASRAKKIWDGIQDILMLLDILSAAKGLAANLNDVTTKLHVPVMEETS